MFRNPKGQDVGWIEGKAYKTKRNARQGQIYLRKHLFGGKWFTLPVGIQKSILQRLCENGIGYVDVLIIGIKPYSYWTRTRVEDILKDGVRIKEDRADSNITKWGHQYIWDVYDKRLVKEQKTLK